MEVLLIGPELRIVKYDDVLWKIRLLQLINLFCENIQIWILQL